MMKKELFIYKVEKFVWGVMCIVYVVKFVGCFLFILLWLIEVDIKILSKWYFKRFEIGG